ncbi:nucleotidyltransferase domain-containing protein [Phascolarctobacterium faecium]|uniref:nucleotidyltransferase domain-containing protein n=1 Tax=Phascolarctobacterium faecium TaxID=33025 RepID=UPI00265F7E1D|nr:nucleotidyltransferase domain-containing protein [Phascolarctobacterium faecium]
MIVETLKQTDIDRAVVFGSRAKGNWRENSDIDIAVFGEGVNVGSLVAQLDELPMPYKFDIVDYNSINSCALREHIDRVGIEIYTK